jgi:hypothetical protein
LTSVKSLFFGDTENETFDELHDEVKGFVERIEKALEAGRTELQDINDQRAVLDNRARDIMTKSGFLSKVRQAFGQ